VEDDDQEGSVNVASISLVLIVMTGAKSQGMSLAFFNKWVNKVK
jgi:hypothetical protein